jgi:hypothetical protein
MRTEMVGIDDPEVYSTREDKLDMYIKLVSVVEFFH